MNGYLTTAEAAARIGITQRRMTAMCIAGRVPGAQRHGRIWMVPAGFRWKPHNTGAKPEKRAARIVVALTKALDAAQTFGKGDHDEFRNLVKHCRELNDILIAAMRRHPAIVTEVVESFAGTTQTRICELEVLAEESTTSAGRT